MCNCNKNKGILTTPQPSLSNTYVFLPGSTMNSQINNFKSIDIIDVRQLKNKSENYKYDAIVINNTRTTRIYQRKTDKNPWVLLSTLSGFVGFKISNFLF